MYNKYINSHGDQAKIGWDKCAHGIPGKQLDGGRTQGTYSQQPTWEADRRVQTVIKNLHKRTAILWKGLNNHLHGSHEQEASRIYAAESEIRQLASASMM